MRIAIVGISGLIGSAVAEALVARGDEVVGVVRTPRPAPDGRPQIVWDPAGGPAPDGAFSGCDAVVNVAGEPIAQRWTATAWTAIVSSRVDATENVARAVARDGVATLVNASAVGWYGSTEHPVDERAPVGTGPLADLCRRWESAAQTVPATVRVVLLRTGIVLSASGGALAKMLPPAKLGLGGPIAGGRQWFPWIHVADAVGLILWAIDGRVAGPVNLVAPGIVRQREFASALGAAVHRPAMVPTPAFALRVALGEGASVVTAGQHVRPAVALGGGYTFRFAELGDALRDLLG